MSFRLPRRGPRKPPQISVTSSLTANNRYNDFLAQALRSKKYFSASGASTDPQNAVITESTLLKYKPSVTQQYLERWCQVTKSFFSYFVSKAGPKTWQAKPLIKVPLTVIDSVQRVFVNVQGNSQDYNAQKNELAMTRRGEPVLFQFEIFLKPTTNLSDIFKSITRTKSSQHRNTCRNNISSVHKSIQLSPEPKSRARLNESKTTTSKTPFEIKSTYLADIASDHCKGMKLGGSVNDVSTRKMQPEITDRILEDVPLAISKKKTQDWMPENRTEELLLVLDGAHFQSPDEKEDYRTFKAKNLAAFKQIGLKLDIAPKNPSAWLPSYSSKSTWSHREIEWNRAERRLLFATDNEELCNSWVCVLNWLVSKQSGS